MKNFRSGKPVLGSALLISSCCIGAGILALPSISAPFGFFFSIILLFFSCLYMYFSGLLILEVYIEGSENINLVGLLDKTLGRVGKFFGIALFLFIFYSILTSYLNASSLVIKDTVEIIFHINISQKLSLILNGTILFLIILFGTKRVDFFNRILFFFMILFYFFAIHKGLENLNVEKFFTFSGNYQALSALPIFVISFGFQNLIPTVSYYLNNNIKDIKSSIIIGLLIPFLIYIFWNFAILNKIPVHAANLPRSSQVFITQLFGESEQSIKTFINYFAFFAILTSLLSVSLSLVNFLSNSSENQEKRIFYALCTVVPPSVFSISNPNIFVYSLKLAGGVGTIALFGILPVLMVWKLRYVEKKELTKIFPFGKGFISLFLLISLLIIIVELIFLLFQNLN